MDAEKAGILRALQYLHDEPKSRVVLEMLARELEGEGRRGKTDCLLTPVMAQSTEFQGSCSNCCPLSDVLERVEMGGKIVSRWFQCPWTVAQMRVKWQKELSKADIMQKCVETIAILEAE